MDDQTNYSANIKAVPPVDDQIVHAFDSGPELISPAPGNYPSAENAAAAFNPGGGIYSPNQFVSTNSDVTMTTAPVQVSTAPAALSDSPHIPHLVFIGCAVALYFILKRKK